MAGSVTLDDHAYDDGAMAIASSGAGFSLTSSDESRVMVIGGGSLGKRMIYCNFVSSTRERIEQAKADWREGRFGEVPGETEFIPLPE